jgi:hypothetical protein
MINQYYAIDACTLIDISKNYNIKIPVFKPIWDKLSEMFENGTLISSSEILEELKDDDLVEWIRPYRKNFLPIDREIQDKTKIVLEKFPGLINIRKGKKSNSNGDPFLVATALHNNCIVVTNEKLVGENGGSCKIPNVCINFGLRYINMIAFIEEIMLAA